MGTIKAHLIKLPLPPPQKKNTALHKYFMFLFMINFTHTHLYIYIYIYLFIYLLLLIASNALHWKTTSRKSFKETSFIMGQSWFSIIKRMLMSILLRDHF